MSKQRLDPDKIANELRGASSFFKQPPTPPERAPETDDPGPSPEKSPRTPVRPVRPARRQMIRHSFELYADQLDRLRELAIEDRQQGGTGSMSKMVRDAIDRLIDEHSPAD